MSRQYFIIIIIVCHSVHLILNHDNFHLEFHFQLLLQSLNREIFQLFDLSRSNDIFFKKNLTLARNLSSFFQKKVKFSKKILLV